MAGKVVNAIVWGFGAFMRVFMSVFMFVIGIFLFGMFPWNKRW
jgi:hypothetical protein